MAAAEVDSEIYQIALLIDELKHTELQCRVASMQKLAQIGEYIGASWDPQPLLYTPQQQLPHTSQLFYYTPPANCA